MDQKSARVKLSLAWWKKDYKSVGLLLKNNRSLLRYGFEGGMTPLSCATSEGNLDMLRILFEIGVDVNQVGYPSSRTALHVAVQHDMYDAALLLINNGAKVDIIDATGENPFELALDLKRLGLANCSQNV